MTKRITADHVKLKRAYEPAAANGGTRILIDRLWARGVKRADAAIDQWVKDIAAEPGIAQMVRSRPGALDGVSPPIRRGGPPASSPTWRIRTLARQSPITLVFSAHDELHNDAVALRDLLLDRPVKQAPQTASRAT